MSPLHYIEKKFNIDAKYFVHGGFWLASAQGMTILASLLSTIFLTRYLSEHNFGVYRYIVSVGAFLTSFSLTGIPQSIFQATLKHIQGFYHKSTILTLRYSLGIVTAGFGTAIYYYLQGNTTLALGTLFVAILTPWSLLLQNAQAYLLGKRNFHAANYLQTIKSFFVAGTTIVALWFSTNILFLIAIYLISQMLASVVAHILLRPKDEVLTEYEEAEKLFQFARHTTIRNIIIGISARIDNILVFQHLGSANLALFTIANLIPDQIKGSLKHLVTLLIPKFSHYNTLPEIRRHLPFRSLQVGIVLIFITIATITLAPFVITTFFPKYISAIFYTQLLALGLPASLYQVPFAMMQAHTQEKALYTYHLYTAIFQIASTIIGIFFFGFFGAIGARIATQYIQLAVSWYTIYRSA